MPKATMLRIVPCTSAPDQNVFDILYQTPMNVITEVFDCAPTSILSHAKKKRKKNIREFPATV